MDIGPWAFRTGRTPPFITAALPFISASSIHLLIR